MRRFSKRKRGLISPLFEITRVLLCFDHTVGLIIYADHSVM